MRPAASGADDEEIEVAAIGRLEDALAEQPPVAPSGQGGGRLPGLAAPRELGLGHEEVEASRLGVEQDLVPVPHEPQRPADGRLGRDVEDHGPPAVPLIRASETRTMSRTPAARSFFGIGSEPASGIPGPPTGPAFWSTRTLSGVTGSAGSSTRAPRSARSRKTQARPR